MRLRYRSVWIALGCFWMTLILNSCAPREVKTGSSTPPPSPQTSAPPATPLPDLRVGMAPNYPPVVFKEQGRLMGLEADFARGLGDELGRRIVLVERPWEMLIPALEAGEIDVIMSGMSITEARQRRVRFVKPYMRVGQMSIIRKADRLELGSPALVERTRGRVGFVAETTGAAYVQEHLPQAQHVPLPSTDAGLEALRAGQIDVFIHDAVTAWRVGSNEANDTLTASYSPLTEEYLAWAVRKTDETLHRDLEAVLEGWRHSEHLRELSRKWLTFRTQ